MWNVWRQIVQGTTLYYRQLNFFLVIAIIGFGAVTLNNQFFSPSNTPQAATELPRALAPKVGDSEAEYDITLEKDGTVIVNGVAVSGALAFERERDKFLLVLVRDAPEFYNRISATVKLPYPADNVEAFLPRIYAIHGVETATHQIIDAQTVQFEATDVFDGATVSIEFTFPKSYFSLSLLGRIRDWAASLSPENWLVVAILFPSISGLFLLSLLIRRFVSYLRVQNNRQITTPPNSMPPAILGALYRGRIGKKEITATLFDLAIRGFISMHQGQNGEVAFSKGANLFNQHATTLRPFEIFLLHQIFGDEGFISRRSNVEVSLSSELFSSRIAMTLLNIYDAALAEGFFIQSPNRYYLKFRAFGLASFFFALLALLFGAFTLHARGYILFLWVGMILASLLIIWISPGLPRRTARGDTTLKGWIAFRNFLAAKQPVDSQETSQFFAYLPYAIVLGCEVEWIARWKLQTLVLPNWYTAQKTLFTADEYGKSLVSVINYLSHALVSSRPPDLA